MKVMMIARLRSTDSDFTYMKQAPLQEPAFFATIPPGRPRTDVPGTSPVNLVRVSEGLPALPVVKL